MKSPPCVSKYPTMHPPLIQPHMTQLHVFTHARAQHSPSLHWTGLTVLMDRCFMIHMFYFHSQQPNMHPPAVQPIMNPCATQSGTYYSFTLDEPCAHFLVDHLYLTCLYLPFTPEESIAYTSFPQFSDLVLVPCLASHSPHPISHCITLPHSPTIFTCYTTPGDDPLPPDHILRALQDLHL